ncbi:hypothetical protein D9M71_414020 [compost metagenome]
MLEDRPRLVANRLDLAALKGQFGEPGPQRIVQGCLDRTAAGDAKIEVIAAGRPYLMQPGKLEHVDVRFRVADALGHIEEPWGNVAGRPCRAVKLGQDTGCFARHQVFRLRRQPVAAAQVYRHGGHAGVAGRPG